MNQARDDCLLPMIRNESHVILSWKHRSEDKQSFRGKRHRVGMEA